MKKIHKLVVENIVSGYGDMNILKGVSINISQEEIVVIIGPNGAGKSTLMKILSGVHRPDAGELEIAGQTVQFHSTRDAENAGVAIIHQELELVEELTVAANVFLGREPRTRFGLLNDAIARRKTGELLDLLEASISPVEMTGGLRVGDQQLV